MTRALDSAMGLPSRSTSASWMLVFLMPADVSSNRMLPLLLTLTKAVPLKCSTPVQGGAISFPDGWGQRDREERSLQSGPDIRACNQGRISGPTVSTARLGLVLSHITDACRHRLSRLLVATSGPYSGFAGIHEIS